MLGHSIQEHIENNRDFEKNFNPLTGDLVYGLRDVRDSYVDLILHYEPLYEGDFPIYYIDAYSNHFLNGFQHFLTL